MISIIIAFRFSKDAKEEKRKNIIDMTFSYWKTIRDLFNIELILVDDFSEEFWINEDFVFKMNGMQKDWNQPAARNYGASLATGDSLLFTDIDHLLYGDFNFIEKAIDGGYYFRFRRKEKTSDGYVEIHSHQNTFLIKRNEFIKYDEDFCGNYGHDDTEFFFRLDNTHQAVLLPDGMIAYCTGLKSTGLQRDSKINRLLLEQKCGDNYPYYKLD